MKSYTSGYGSSSNAGTASPMSDFARDDDILVRQRIRMH